MMRSSAPLKRGLLFFWAAWLTLVFASNFCDGLKVCGWLPGSWAFASGNYDFLVQTTARYGPPAWVNGLLFVGVIAWEAAAALLFWHAGLRFRGRDGRAATRLAFTAGLGLWAAFMLADEICIAYPVEATHLRLLIGQLASLLVIELLPDAGTGDGTP
jgi:hypothetical protein